MGTRRAEAERDGPVNSAERFADPEAEREVAAANAALDAEATREMVAALTREMGVWWVIRMALRSWWLQLRRR